MCENFNRVFVYMLREFLKQTDPKTIRDVSKERMLIQKKTNTYRFSKIFRPKMGNFRTYNSDSCESVQFSRGYHISTRINLL